MYNRYTLQALIVFTCFFGVLAYEGVKLLWRMM